MKRDTVRRLRRLGTRGAASLAVVACTATALTATVPQPAVAARPRPGDAVYPVGTRLICHLPSKNTQGVLGYDTGHSFVWNNKAYWAAGDSFIDGNGNGIAGDPLGFRTGTIGATSDLYAEDCIDNITYRPKTDGTGVESILTPDPAKKECLVWPGAPFEAAGRLYFFYTSVRDQSSCTPDLTTKTFVTGLGQLTKPGTTELGPARVTEMSWRDGFALGTLKLDGYIYLFPRIAQADGGPLHMVRVAETSIANPSEYNYWTAAGWQGQDSAAAASTIATGVETGVTVRYNAFIRRYLMVYPCHWSSAVCTRTAKIPGDGSDALEGGWNDETTLLQCAGFACGHAFWHSGYESAEPNRIYVTTAHIAYLGSRQYFVNLYSIDLALRPPPRSQSTALSERDFDVRCPPPSENSPRARALPVSRDRGTPATPWSYMSYDPSAAGLDLQALTKQTSSPAPPSILPPTDDTRDGFCSVAADTGETVQSRPAPGIFALGMYPSPTRGAARVWTASTAGYARISAEAWREAAGVGDGSVAEIYLIQKRRAGATVTPLVEPRRLTRPDEPFRVAPDDLGRIRVQRGDQIVFGVHRGTAPNNNALWDTTLFQSSVHLSSR